MRKPKTLALLFVALISMNGATSAIKATTNSFDECSENSQMVTGLSESDITKYLGDLGYTAESTPVQDGDNWTCNTSKGGYHYETTVFTDGTNIIAHEDVRL